MPPDAYDDILSRAQSELSPEQRKRLAAELCGDSTADAPAKRRITDLRGIGKEVWRGVDPDHHVAQERDAWRG